jgi:tetratricopeptide (TPR) repeat protein
MLAADAAVLSAQSAWQTERQQMIRLREEGHVREAYDMSRKTLARAERKDSNAPPLALALHDFAVLSGDLGEYVDGERALRRALHALEAMPAEDPHLHDLFRLQLAELYLDWGRRTDAKPILTDLIHSWQSTVPNSQELAVALDNLAWVELVERHFVPAEQLLKQSIGILETLPDAAPARIGNTLNDLASFLFSTKRFEEAAGYAERSESILARRGPIVDSTLMNTWTVLSASYAALGRNERAESYARQSVSAAQSVYGEDSRRAARIMAIAGYVLERCGKKSEGKSMRKNAQSILAKADRDDPGRFTIDVNSLR